MEQNEITSPRRYKMSIFSTGATNPVLIHDTVQLGANFVLYNS